MQLVSRGARWRAWGMVLTLATSPVTGQEVPRAGPSFLSVRYASRSSLTFYGGYAAGPGLIFVGLVQNPRTEYREALLGVGRSWSDARGNGALLGAAAARASDAWYLQVYLLPTLRVGPFEANGTLEYYQPLEENGVIQASAAPANLYLVLSRRVALGASYVGTVQERAADSHAVGPSLRVGIPRGSLTFDWLRRLKAAPAELRITAASQF